MPPSAEPPGGAPPARGPGVDVRGRRERAARVGAPHLAPAALALAAGALVWLSWGQLRACGRAAVTSPETQVREALAAQRRAGIPDAYGFRAGGAVQLDEVRYADVQVAVEGGKARVVAVVEASGRVVWREEQAAIVYIGREVFSMAPCTAAGWCADGQQFQRLRGVLSALFRRGDAANAGDLEALARLLSERWREPGGKAAAVARLRAAREASPGAQVRVLGWQIRVERDGATVGEDHEVLRGGGPPEARRVVYELVREDDRWRFVAGGA